MREVKKSGQSFVHCRLQSSEVVLAVPLWMFDRQLCSSFYERDIPEVDWRAVRELGALLCDAALLPLEQEHSNVNPGGNDRSLGGSSKALRAECPLLANSGLFGAVPRTSALHSTRRYFRSRSRTPSQSSGGGSSISSRHLAAILSATGSAAASFSNAAKAFE